MFCGDIPELSLEAHVRVTDPAERENQGLLIPDAVYAVAGLVIDIMAAAFKAFGKFAVNIKGSALVVAFNTDLGPFSGRKAEVMEYEFISVTPERELARAVPVADELGMRAPEENGIHGGLRIRTYFEFHLVRIAYFRHGCHYCITSGQHKDRIRDSDLDTAFHLSRKVHARGFRNGLAQCIKLIERHCAGIVASP